MNENNKGLSNSIYKIKNQYGLKHTLVDLLKSKII